MLQTPQINSQEKWFDDMITSLKVDQFMIETGTAGKEKQQMYEKFFSGDLEGILKLQKEMTQKHFALNIVTEFISHMGDNLPKTVAFDFNGSEVLCWLEIDNNDVETERQILIAEAKINAKYHPSGFDLETMICESWENLKVPSHYVLLNQDKDNASF